jgi:hypothetical protein
VKITRAKRPDLLEKMSFSADEEKILRKQGLL